MSDTTRAVVTTARSGGWGFTLGRIRDTEPRALLVYGAIRGLGDIRNDAQVRTPGRGIRRGFGEHRARVGDTQAAQTVRVHERGTGATTADGPPGDSVEECREVGILGGGVEIRVPNQIPTPGRGDPQGVSGAQIPRVRFLHGRQRPDHRGGIRIDIGERGDRTIGTSRAAATTVLTHEYPE